MNLSPTGWAFNNARLVIFFLLILVVVGPISYVSHPSREDPEITIRVALVTARLPGLAPGRVEDLITHKLEEKIREMPEVDDITTTSSHGQSIVRVELHPKYFDLDPIWQDLRNKIDDVKPELPTGTQGPFVNDEYGDVSMATIALTGDGFSLANLRENARKIRDRLYSVIGIKKAELFGIEPERIYVEINNARLAQFGISPDVIFDAIGSTNIISPGGQIDAGLVSFTVEPSGNFNTLEEVGQVTVNVPDRPNEVIYLRDLANITRAYVEPPKNPILFNGKPAIVISVQMVDQFDSQLFAQNLDKKVRDLENQLPIGYALEYITFQPDDIAQALSNVTNNLYQTIAIVLVVVIAFLGFRTGLIVGVMVPLTMLMTILIMRYVGIELERMSLATLIISLGLLVDNGIVMAEEIGRRLSIGEQRGKAVIETGKAMATPLLASSLTTIVAFMPLMLAVDTAGEYTRSISLVIAISLLSSWLLAMTVTPLFCYWFLKTPEPVDEAVVYATPFYDKYRNILNQVTRLRFLVLALIMGALIVSVWGLKFVPKLFFPASERTQLQVYVDLPVGANTWGVIDSVESLVNWLGDKEQNPDITSNIAYVANGGPRFYLSLDPIDPDRHRAFVLVNTDDHNNNKKIAKRILAFAAANLPNARVDTKPMSLGSSEAGLVEYRIIGPDADRLSDLAELVKGAFRNIDGTINIRDDWENRIVKIYVNIDQARAQRAGVTSESVADRLQSFLSGTSVSDYREGDTIIPVYFRSKGQERTNIDRMRTLNVARVDESTVPLLQIADFQGIAEFSMIQRRNIERVITVEGSNPNLTAATLNAKMQPYLKNLTLGNNYRLEIGGEIEDSAKAQGALFANMPLALVVIILILVGQFGSFRKPAIILGVIPLTLIGVTIGLLITPGAKFGFMAILGLLSLAGIIINNAIVLIDRIEIERDLGLNVDNAIITASVKRLRPILMTTVTTILGLSPLIISRDVLFFDLAIVLSFGLLVGTILTLGVIPILYGMFCRKRETVESIE